MSRPVLTPKSRSPTPLRSPRRRGGNGSLAPPPTATVTFDTRLSPASEAVLVSDAVREASSPSVVRGRDAVLRRSLALVDIAAIYLALVFVVIAVPGGALHLRPAAILLAPFVVLAAKALGVYDRDQHVLHRSTLDELASILYLSALSAFTVWLAESLLLHGSLARPQIFSLLGASFVLTGVGRALARALTLAATPAERCLVLATAADARKMAAKLANTRGVKATLVGQLPFNPEYPDRHSAGAQTLADPGALARLIVERRVERVIIVPARHDQEQILDAIRLIRAFGIKVSVVTRPMTVVGSLSDPDDVELGLLGR